MKTVTDKYLEMNHNFIELRDSIFQKVKDEKLEKEIYNKLILCLGTLNDFLTFYKKENNINTNIIEEDEDKDLTVDDLEIIEV